MMDYDKLAEREIEMMLEYVPAYSLKNAENIKNKFESKANRPQRKVSLKKWAVIGIAAAMTFTTLTYAGMIDLNKIYSRVFGENAQYIEPYIDPLTEGNIINSQEENDSGGDDLEINASLSLESEYDGIVIRLISAINDENALRIFLTATDTKENRLGDRLDFTSWGLDQGYGGNISVVDYDSATKTAMLMITSLGDDHGNNAVLTIDGISAGRQLIEDLPEDNIHIDTLLKTHPIAEIITQEEIWKRGGGGNSQEIFDNSQLLKPDAMSIPFDNTDQFTITNIGFVDGRFHIQVKTPLEGTALINGYYINLKFVNSAGETVYNITSRIDFITDKKYAYAEHSGEPHDAYSELIFEDITNQEQLKDLALVIDYMEQPQIIEGQWRFSFAVPEKAAADFHINKEITINDRNMVIETLSLSPLGVTIHLPENLSGVYSHRDTVKAVYNDGTVILLDQSAIHTYEDESTLVFSGPVIETEKVQTLIINEVHIDIQQQ